MAQGERVAGVMVSHRSGETEDTFIADLVVWVFAPDRYKESAYVYITE